MVLKKHNGFSFVLIVIVLLFFNSASLSSFTFKTFFENSEFAHSSLRESPTEAVEESSVQAFFEAYNNDFSFRQPLSNRLSKKESKYIIFDYKEWLPKFSFVSYNPLLRPAYYHFLFRHNLF